MKENFAKAHNSKIDRILIYYSGHGDKPTGGWVTYGKLTMTFNGVRIVISEILNIAKETNYSKQIELTTD